MKDKTLFFSTKLPFGKYKGQTLYDIMKSDPNYFVWIIPKWKGLINWKVKESYLKLSKQ